jgi:hypothetical protein
MFLDFYGDYLQRFSWFHLICFFVYIICLSGTWWVIFFTVSSTFVLIIVFMSHSVTPSTFVQIIIHIYLNSFPRPGREAQSNRGEMRRSRSWERHCGQTQHDTPSGWKHDELRKEKSKCVNLFLVWVEKQRRTERAKRRECSPYVGCKESWSQCTTPSRSPKEYAAKEITTDNKNEPHTRFLRRYWHVLTDRIVGEPPAFRGKPRFCEKDTVKRRNENERWKKTADEWWTLEVKNSSSTQASSRHGVLPFGWGRCSSNTTANWLGTATGNCPTLTTCPPVKNSPDPSIHLKGPTGSPDHHRGLHKHHIRRCGPSFLF